MLTINENDYEEVRDERESKTFRIIKGCFKGLLYGASALVWILILYTVISTREAKIYDRMQFTESTRRLAEENEDFRVTQIIISTFMNEQGNITIDSNSCYYAAETGELELGVKYNKKLTDGDTDDAIIYVLKDQDGNAYSVVNLEEDVIGRYGYARVCFGGLSLPIDDNTGEVTLTLTMYRKSDGELLTTYTKRDGNDVYEVNDSVFTVFEGNSATRGKDFED